MEEDIGTAVVLLDEPEPLQVIEAIDNAGHQRKRRGIDVRLETAATAILRTSRGRIWVGFQNRDRIGRGTLGTHADGELDAVAFTQALITNSGPVNEEILFTTVTFDKTVTLFRVVPLDCSRGHDTSLCCRIPGTLNRDMSDPCI